MVSMKPFGGEITLGLESTATRGEQNCNWRGSNRRRRNMWRSLEILKNGSSDSVTRY